MWIVYFRFCKAEFCIEIEKGQRWRDLKVDAWAEGGERFLRFGRIRFTFTPPGWKRTDKTMQDQADDVPAEEAGRDAVGKRHRSE